MQDDAKDCIDGTMGKLVGLGDEVAGCIVDENIKRSLSPDVSHHGVHGFRVADIDGMHRDIYARLTLEFFFSHFQLFQPAATDHDVGSELCVAAADIFTQTRAATGY